MIRVLNVCGLGMGGIETTVMNYYRHIDRSKIQFDFLVTDFADHYYYEDEAISLGARIFRRPMRTKNPIGNMKGIIRVLRENPEIQIIHIHNSTSVIAIDLLVASLFKVPIRIAHGRSAPLHISMLHKLFRPLLWITSTHKVAISSEAGVYLFGARVKNDEKLILIHNARDLKLFRFNVDTRKRLRQEMGLENNFVVIHVGRLHPVKNQTFLLESFARAYIQNPDFVLLIVGEGELRNVLEQQVNELGLASCVRLLGIRSDIPDLLQAADLFVLPSLHEGLGTVSVEAQVAGLQVLVSDTVTPECKVTENIVFLPIDKGVEIWSNQMTAYRDFIRKDMSEAVSQSGYDIHEAAKLLESFYHTALTKNER